MKFAGDVAADLDSHPTAAVVINPIHGVIGVVCREGIADHGVPLAGEVAPAFLALWKSDKDRPHRATHLGMWAVASGHDWRDVIEVVYDHLVGQDFPFEEPERKIFREYLRKADGVGNVARRTHEFSSRIVITAIESLCPTDIFFGKRFADSGNLQFPDRPECDGQHALVFTDNRGALRVADDVELAQDKLRVANGFAARVIRFEAIFRCFAQFIHWQASAEAATI